MNLNPEIHMIQSYMIIASANGYVMGHSTAAPSPYAVWQVDDNGEGVSNGHYFVDREETEWDFCARAFEWFEDNMYVHMIEDETAKSVKPPIEARLIDGLKEIRTDIAAISQLVDEMAAEVDRLAAEREAMKCRGQR